MDHAPDDEGTPQEDTTDVQQDGRSTTTLDGSAAASPETASTSHTPDAAAAPAPAIAPASQPTTAPGQTTSQAAPGNLAEVSARLRHEAAEITEIAAQAGRLGIAIDAAKALRDGTPPEALRCLVLERASAAADARDILAAPPSPVLPQATESPIVAAAKRDAAASRRT